MQTCVTFVEQNTIRAQLWSESGGLCVRWSRMVLNEITRFAKAVDQTSIESFKSIVGINYDMKYHVCHFVRVGLRTSYIVSIHLHSTHIIWAGLDGLGSSNNCHKMRTRNR